MVYITGDTHIPVDIAKLNSKRFPAQKDLSKDDFLIICGDFGGVWNNDHEEIYWRKWLEQKRFTTLFIDGNHENFNLLNEFEIVDFHGGKAHKISNSIYHLMRGQIYEIDGKRIFTFGGASSHDKEYRTKDKNWWEEELPSENELKFAQKNLENVDWKVDYIVTHTLNYKSIQVLASMDKYNEIKPICSDEAPLNFYLEQNMHLARYQIYNHIIYLGAPLLHFHL